MSQAQFFPLRGGLDQQTPNIAIPPGKCINVLNHESAPDGYRRTDGFERFDGHPAPSDAEFYTLTFTVGIVAFAAGDVITGNTSGATATVLDVAELDSGTFGGGNAVGSVAVSNVSGIFLAAELLKVGGVTHATLNTIPTLGDWREGDQQLAWLTTSQTNTRNLIQPVPGSGPVRGVVHYADRLNAWRDNAAGTACVLYHSTAAGWVATDLGKSLSFTGGGPYEIQVGDVITGDQSAATATVRYIGLDTGDWTKSSAAGVLILDNVVGTFGDESISVGTQLGIADITTSPQAVTFPAGGIYEFDVFNFYATDSFERCYGANGVSKAFEFDGSSIVFITSGMEASGLADTPHIVREHKEHLFLAFQAGSLQHSALGTPRDFSGVEGAAELGLGHNITSLIPNNAASMLIFTDETTTMLTGNDSSDWLLEPLATKDAGAKAYTAQRIGDVVYLDNRGIRNAQATATFANFRLGSYASVDSKELFRKNASGIQPVASAVIKAKDQYLLFFDDGSGISLWFGAKSPELMLFQYPFVVSCPPWTVEIDSIERVFVGATNGYVYELNSGNSFDGDVIEAYLQLPYSHQGSPRLVKRYQKLELELTGSPGVEIGLVADFDLGNGEQPFMYEDSLSVQGGGGLWGVAVWGEFMWSSPIISKAEFWIDGMGPNMSAIFVSRQSTVPSYTISGVTTVYSPRGAKR